MTPCSYTTANLSNTSEQVLGSISQSPCTAVPELLSPLAVCPSSDWQHEIIFRFCNRTVLTMGSPTTIAKYAEVVPRLAIQHEHLLHVIIATTLLHDRALSGSESTASESYHLSHAAAKFKEKLSIQITDADKDALWATGVYMCVTSVFNIGTSNVEEAWPLRTHVDDLKWLNLQAGLRVIWSLANFQRPHGVFADLVDCPDENCVFPRLPEPGVVGLPPVLIDLCGLDDRSDGSNNPYHTAVRHLCWLLPFKCSSSNMLSFMVFAGGMTSAYKSLLQQRDPRALLLMAIWYSRLFTASWWMAPRANIECRAIYRYLDRLHICNCSFQRVLSLIGRACELQESVSPTWIPRTYEPLGTTFALPLVELMSLD